MSTSELDRFSADLKANLELQESVTGIGSDIDALVKLANEKGYDFTKDEMLQRVEEKCSEQLSDEELDKVAGGADDKKGEASFLSAVLGVEAICDAII